MLHKAQLKLSASCTQRRKKLSKTDGLFGSALSWECRWCWCVPTCSTPLRRYEVTHDNVRTSGERINSYPLLRLLRLTKFSLCYALDETRGRLTRLSVDAYPTPYAVYTLTPQRDGRFFPSHHGRDASETSRKCSVSHPPWQLTSWNPVDLAISREPVKYGPECKLQTAANLIADLSQIYN